MELSVTSGSFNVLFWGAIGSLVLAYLVGPAIWLGSQRLVGVAGKGTIRTMEVVGETMVVGGIIAFLILSVLLVTTTVVRAYALRTALWPS